MCRLCNLVANAQKAKLWSRGPHIPIFPPEFKSRHDTPAAKRIPKAIRTALGGSCACMRVYMCMYVPIYVCLRASFHVLQYIERST